MFARDLSRPQASLVKLESSRPRIFILSPAFAGGRRAQMIMRKQATFGLAERLRSPGGASLGEVFAFLSGLYFRGKLAYARRFASPLLGDSGALVITPTRGLLDVDTAIGVSELREFAEVNVDESEPRYRIPMERAAKRFRTKLPADCDVVLLGSIATGKYVTCLQEVFGARLLFPADFVGRGDMSRGGLLLRAAADGVELDYLPIEGAARKGRRPPKLQPRRYPKECATN